MITAIFWDNDGILVDTEPYYFRATRDVLAGVGVELTQALYIDLLLEQAKGAWHLAAAKGCDEETLESLRIRRNALYLSLLETEEIAVPGVEPVLKQLHGKYRMGVVTSSKKDAFETIHRRTGFLRYFDFVLANGDYAASKPDPAPYLAALEQSGLPREQCVVIEDSRRGLTAAKAAGLRCWVIPTDLTAGQDFSRADAVLNAIGDVPGMIEENSG